MVIEVINKRTNQPAVAEVLGNGKVKIFEIDSTEKEIAESTFKRWYKKVNVKKVEEQPQVAEEQVAPSVEQSSEEEQTDSSEEEKKFNPALLHSEVQETRGGKCEKVVTIIRFLNFNLEITEYNGFITDVNITNSETGDLVYKSKKMSIKDALNWIGLAGSDLKEAKKEIMALRKKAKRG
jgi:hypothetical protein